MSAFNTKLTLYDFASTIPEGKSVSPYAARVRYILNYRQLSYKTEWIKFGEIANICKENGFEPTGVGRDGSSPKYTIPVLVDETSGKRVAISDSLKIIKYLEATYPDPTRPVLPSIPAGGNSVALPIHRLAETYMRTAVVKVFPLAIPDLYKAIDPDSREHWKNTVLGPGKTIEEVSLKKGSQEYERAVNDMRDAFKALAACFDGSTKKWVMGDQPTYVDFAMLSGLMLVKLGSPESWQEIATIDNGRWEKFVEAGKEYMELK